MDAIAKALHALSHHDAATDDCDRLRAVVSGLGVVLTEHTRDPRLQDVLRDKLAVVCTLKRRDWARCVLVAALALATVLQWQALVADARAVLAEDVVVRAAAVLAGSQAAVFGEPDTCVCDHEHACQPSPLADFFHLRRLLDI